MKVLGKHDLDAAILGGLLLSAGGSGVAASPRHRALGEEALRIGKVVLKPLEDFQEDEWLAVATAVGAPGANKARTRPQDSVDAARALQDACGKNLAGVMVAHVPGLYAWTMAAGLGIPLADAGTNGRAHPTEPMGGMGLISDPAARIWQVGVAGSAEPPLRVLAHGHPEKTSHVLRAASAQNGGLINAARGPFSVGFVRAKGAPGAITFALKLGEAMRAAKGPDRAAAAAKQLGGEVLIDGEVSANSVTYAAGFEVGTLTVSSGSRSIEFGVYNEFMTAVESGRRILSFPDFLGSLDPATGDPVAVSVLKMGTRVAMVSAPRNKIPLGAGVFDPAVYPQAEAAMNMALAKYALET
jgi:DUF917 family protein